MLSLFVGIILKIGVVLIIPHIEKDPTSKG